MDINKLVQSEITKRAMNISNEIEQQKNTLENLQRWQEAFEKIPEEANYWINAGGKWVTIEFYASSKNNAEELRGLYQPVFHKPAERSFSRYNGEVSYVFKATQGDPNQYYLEVRIHGGRPAPTCRIEEVEVTRKEFKMVCPEGEEQAITN